MIKQTILSVCLAATSIGQVAGQTGDFSYLLVGSYTQEDMPGIYVYRFDTQTGESEFVSNIDGVKNPSYLTLSADEKYVYSVGENEGNEGSANAFRFDKQQGNLTFINSQLTKGASPCYISTDRNARMVVTANYSGGSISVFPLTKEGTLLPTSQVIQFSGSGKDETRQKGPHLHCVKFSPDEKHLFATDLGTDCIHLFTVKGDQLIESNPASVAIEAGSGPRHLTFHPSKSYAYLINEISGMVTVFDYHKGVLKPIQYIAADKVGGEGSADIHLSPDGKFLYASNRLKEDGVAIFRVKGNGTLEEVGYQLTGKHPRSFVLSLDGNFLLVANRDSNNIQAFKRDPQTGLLTHTGKEIKLSKPVCLKFARR